MKRLLDEDVDDDVPGQLALVRSTCVVLLIIKGSGMLARMSDSRLSESVLLTSKRESTLSSLERKGWRGERLRRGLLLV